MKWCNDCEHKEICDYFSKDDYCIFDFAIEYHKLAEKILDNKIKMRRLSNEVL